MQVEEHSDEIPLMRDRAGHASHASGGCQT